MIISPIMSHMQLFDEMDKAWQEGNLNRLFELWDIAEFNGLGKYFDVHMRWLEAELLKKYA